MFSKKNKRLITSVICTAMAFQIFAFIPDNRTYALDFDFSDLFKNDESSSVSSTQNEVNISEISSDTVTLGDYIVLQALSSGVDTSKCKYAFYVKHESSSNWVTLGDYANVSRFTWTPERLGNYSVCIKIKIGWFNVYKKYFDVKVLSKLKNISYISTSELPLGDALSISGKSIDGSGLETYAYYIQKPYSDNWTQLSSFTTAKLMTWKPSEAGNYSVCVKVKDSSGNIKEKYFDLSVYNRETIKPMKFSISLLSPISAPYQWSCSISDESIVSVDNAGISSDDYTSATSKGAYTNTVLDFSTLRAGQTSITLKYSSYGGETYSIKYDVTVDKNLNLTVNKSDGKYFINELPQVEIKESKYTVTVKNTTYSQASWQQSVSDSNITELVSAAKTSDGDTKYTFAAKREGKAVVTLSYKLYGKTDPLYVIIYNISIDKDLVIHTSAVGGNYFDDDNYPEIMQIWY